MGTYHYVARGLGVFLLCKCQKWDNTYLIITFVSGIVNRKSSMAGVLCTIIKNFATSVQINMRTEKVCTFRICRHSHVGHMPGLVWEGAMNCAPTVLQGTLL